MSEQDERQLFVNGLRQLANFMESHPELPVPCCGGQHDVFVKGKSELSAIARVPHMRWEKLAIGDYFALVATFNGGHSYHVNVERKEVCRKVITGTRMVEAVPAHEVEEFHWVCDEPLMAGAK